MRLDKKQLHIFLSRESTFNNEHFKFLSIKKIIAILVITYNEKLKIEKIEFRE